MPILIADAGGILPDLRYASVDDPLGREAHPAPSAADVLDGPIEAIP